MSSSIVSTRSKAVKGDSEHASCSMECYKEHKAAHEDDHLAMGLGGKCAELPPKPPTVNSSEVTIAIATQATNTSANLESSPTLQSLYLMYPTLRAQLHEVYVSTLEPPAGYQDGEHRGNGRFNLQSGRRRGRGISRGGSRGKGAPWNHQRGQNYALSRMRKIKVSEGKDGDGMREFSRLVLGLVESVSST